MRADDATVRTRGIPDVGIRGARAADLAAMLGLLQDAHLPVGGLEACLETAVVAHADGRIVGAAALEPHGDAALLRSVVVDPGLRRSGLGARLVAAAVDLARDAGVRELYLLTETAEPFFARLGWQRIARDGAPADVRGSVEFTELCPASARAMRLRLEADPGA